MERHSHLSQDMFITLSFHAKLHALLDKFSHPYTDSERAELTSTAEKDTYHEFERQMDTVIEKIDKKEMAASPHQKAQLEELRGLVHELEKELTSISEEKERKGRT